MAELAVMELCLAPSNPYSNQVAQDNNAKPAPSVQGGFAKPSGASPIKPIIKSESASSSEPPKVSASILSKSDITLDHLAVMEKWPEFLVKIKNYQIY